MYFKTWESNKLHCIIQEITGNVLNLYNKGKSFRKLESYYKKT